MSTRNILWFDEINRDDVAIVGGKSSSLGELTSHVKVPVPYGFATTVHAYRHFMDASGVNDKVNLLLAKLDDIENTDLLHEIGTQIRATIMQAPMPADLAQDFSAAYQQLAQRVGQTDPFVAIRSSATSEDLPDASFAGQQDTYLNIKGTDDVIAKIKECYASLFTDRAIYYRAKQAFPQEKVALSAAVQMMIPAVASGIMFTLNVVDGNTSQIMIDGIWGLGEYNVQGIVTPDDWLVDKQHMQIVSRTIATQDVMLTRKPDGGVVEQKVAPDKANQAVLTDEQVLQLAEYGKKIEQHYGCCVDTEWALDNHNKLWMVQARPETVWSKQHSQNDDGVKTMETTQKVLLRGLPASPGVATGIVHVIDDPQNIDEFKQGEILVTTMTSPDWVPAMEKAAGIITDSGGMTCHAAIVSREMQIPCLVGTKSLGASAMATLKTGQEITLDAKNGVVYAGNVTVAQSHTTTSTTTNNVEYFAPTATQVMMNLGNPDLAEKYASLPADGIGLLREEFLWTSYIHEHPLYMIDHGEAQKAIDMLADGIAKVARTFAPRPVILRFSDFKSGEYRNLKGGDQYEPHEPADLLGWRGASRYYDPKYREGFKLELAAVKKVRNYYGLKNLNVMIPFVRTVDEIKEITTLMQDAGLKRSADFKVLMMAEIPSNIILADQFNQYIDGYSIGSNDLTMLILGCDRNNDAIAHLYDERNLAIKRAIRHLIKVAHRDGKTVSICGQTPSEYPEYTNFLIQSGIDYVSVNPDMVKTTKRNVAHFEQRILLDKATGKGLQDPTDYEW